MDCDKRAKLPDVTLTLGGLTFALSADDYVLEWQNACLSVFAGLDMADSSGPLAILGQPFLRRWYSVYDMGNKSIRLALAK